ncbi:acetyl/propionyl/methylcrotonyl-CoA carboxylase subunit alpha [Ramlibacter sp.]|uniref:acetyl/propionyl/methylcrotonyl-CoA carboxylase subunit alpha n=1 Tax=Ramlibacter sp. TaxID=1917967 RepID=UPI002FC9A608
MRFDTLLIANRGEIALRVMRTARRLGLRTVAVYSDADADSLHVREADLAVRLGPADAANSYRNTDAILGACRRTGAQAVHPGYGFLSENAAFAQAVADAGLVFVGPPARVIELMGNKAQAKIAMRDAGVPTVPGAQGCRTDASVLEAAGRIGYPLILKAAAGGGGRGMRVVHTRDQLLPLFALARSEALGAFGSDEIIIERAIEHARHIEIQVLCDEHGTCLHLGERDCSTQRRFQKVIEEAPSPAVDAPLRQAMGEIASKACEAIGYTGVGTLEFLLGADRSFYFMEMNTRLQVEHGVTELVTGLDLVEQQLRVAQGERLSFAQADVRLSGHAIELRVCAEDPAAGYLPQVGRIERWQAPADVRTDTMLESGYVVGPHYDSMVAKVLAGAPSRDECIQKLVAACDRTVLLGIRSNLGFLQRCLRHPAFRAGEVTTGFLAQQDLQGEHWRALPSEHALAAAALVLGGLARQRAAALAPPTALWLSPAPESAPGSPAPAARQVQIEPQADGSLTLKLGNDAGADGAADRQRQVANLHRAEHELGFALEGVFRRLAWFQPDPDCVWIQDGADAWLYRRVLRFERAGEGGAEDRLVRAPMSGRVIALPVAEGEQVGAGAPLLVMESMKMEMPLCARSAGRVARVLVEVGAQLSAGQLLVELEAA